MIKVGIPRALAYYQYYPMWRTFFEALDATVVVSPPTTQKMLGDGSQRVVADTCLPAKVFMGHVLTLVDKCDFVFIPIIRSIQKKAYNCAKFLGLPDMTRAVIPECPTVLDINVDVNKGLDKLEQDVYRLGLCFTKNKLKIKKAMHDAWQAHLSYQQLMSGRRLMPPQAIASIYEKTESAEDDNTDDNLKALTIAVVGHHYLLYDEQTNHRLVHRLARAGCRVVTPSMLTAAQLEAASDRSANRAYWTWEEEVVGAGNCYMSRGVDGIIGVAAFGCGPDSIMMEIVRRQAMKQGNTPFMMLTLEEHTADTGILTRLEAFIDMIHRRKRRLTCV